MSDDDPEVTHEQEARLRRLLARARHDEPLPLDIAARLDRVLVQLAAEESDPDAGRSVVDLAGRRRRRVSILLAAAAAVVVAGVGFDQLTMSSQEAASPASGTADAGSATSAESGDFTGADSSLADDSTAGLERQGQQEAPQPFDAPAQQAPAAPGGGGLLPEPVRLGEDDFAQQAVRYSARRGVVSFSASVIAGEELSRSEAFVCEGAAWGEGVLLPALYDGVPTVLAYRPVAGKTQTVDLLRCGSGEVLRSTVLPIDG